MLNKIEKKLFSALSLSIISLAATATPVAAAGFTFDTAGTVPFTNLGSLLANILIVLFFFAAVLAFVFIVIGGIQWITAGGDKMAAQSARDRITAAVVGLVIVVAAFGITFIVLTVLGINIFSAAGITFPSPPGAIF